MQTAYRLKPPCILVTCYFLYLDMWSLVLLVVYLYYKNQCVTLCFRYVLQELVDTERDYVKDLGCVVEVSVCKSSIRSNKQFANIKKRKRN